MIGRLGIVLLSSPWQEAAAQISILAKTISVDSLVQEKSRVTIIDVRYAGDYSRGHIDGAISLPYYRLDKITLPKDKALVTYCSGIGCSLSQEAAMKLKELGYTNVRVLLGGISEWELKGQPVVRERIDVKPAGPGVLEGGEASAHVVKKHLDRLFILDVRPETEFVAGHLPGARNIPLERLREGLSEISGEALVCDRLPKRWKKAVEILKETGYDAHALSGGVGAWMGSGYALETGADAR
jgi:rhodanese-related sulfurtransferase